MATTIQSVTTYIMPCGICHQIGHNRVTCTQKGAEVCTIPAIEIPITRARVDSYVTDACAGAGVSYIPAPEHEATTNVKVIPSVKIETPPLSSVDKSERIKRLREHLTLAKANHQDEVMKLATLKEAHVYCVDQRVSPQQYGPLLEKFIRTKFNYIKNKAEDCTGDCSKDGKNSEVKVSLGGATHTKFNFVQIRPSHDCEIYILTAYHLSTENVESEGDLHVFKVPKSNMKAIVVSYGGYAHGTAKEHGKITIDSLNEEKSTKEYALRPTINDDCWNALLPFKVPESEL